MRFWSIFILQDSWHNSVSWPNDVWICISHLKGVKWGKCYSFYSGTSCLMYLSIVLEPAGHYCGPLQWPTLPLIENNNLFKTIERFIKTNKYRITTEFRGLLKNNVWVRSTRSLFLNWKLRSEGINRFKMQLSIVLEPASLYCGHWSETGGHFFQ